MARPIVAKPLSHHRLALVRMQQSIEVDEKIEQQKKQRLIALLELMVCELGAALSDSLKAS